MCRTPNARPLSDAEIGRADFLRRKPQWDGKPLSWRAIARLLQRDHSGLRRAVRRHRSMMEST
jgi:hypothetical protein